MFRNKSSASRRLGIYIHVPFCLSKCAYCDFYSFRPGSPESAARYVDALISHMESYRDGTADYVPDSVFIGGGTPTALPEDELIRLIRSVKKIFRLSHGCEFTVEANPATLTLRLLKRMRRAGVSRLSLGLQSASNSELKTLSRVHTREQFEESFRLCRQAKFHNINVDLMFGIPGQTVDSLMRSLAYLCRLGPEHISLYNLRVEPETPFGRALSEGRLALPGEDAEADMYLGAVAYLEGQGYRQYEVSNFARRGYMCRHNLKYWNCDEYLGFGPAAHSFFGGNRFSFLPDATAYVRGTLPMNSGVQILASCDEIGEKQRMGEYVMLRLRLRDGIDSRTFYRRFGRDFAELYGRKLEKYFAGGYAGCRDGRYFLTAKGLFVSNYILSDILDFADLGSAGFNGTK